MSFAANLELLQDEPAECWNLDDRIGLGPDAESDPDDWPAWTDTRIGLGPVVPEVPSPTGPSRRGFMAGLAGLVAGASPGRHKGSLSPSEINSLDSPIATAHRRLIEAQQEVNRRYALPHPTEKVDAFEDWQNKSRDDADAAYDNLVGLVAGIAGLDLADLPNANRDGSERWEHHQEPLASVVDGDRVYTLVLSARQAWSINHHDNADDDNALRGVRLVVVPLDGKRAVPLPAEPPIPLKPPASTIQRIISVAADHVFGIEFGLVRPADLDQLIPADERGKWTIDRSADYLMVHRLGMMQADEFLALDSAPVHKSRKWGQP